MLLRKIRKQSWLLLHGMQLITDISVAARASRFVTKATMPATMIRLNLVKGLGPVLQIAEGWTVELPEDVSDTLWKRTDYTWPCTWFVPRCDWQRGAFKSAYDVMNNWGANHGAISYGHIGADLITMCSMLRIPVCMHNVSEDQIFRPAAWTLSVWIKKALITVHARITDHYTNNGMSVGDRQEVICRYRRLHPVS